MSFIDERRLRTERDSQGTREAERKQRRPLMRLLWLLLALVVGWMAMKLEIARNRAVWEKENKLAGRLANDGWTVEREAWLSNWLMLDDPRYYTRVVRLDFTEHNTFRRAKSGEDGEWVQIGGHGHREVAGVKTYDGVLLRDGRDAFYHLREVNVDSSQLFPDTPSPHMKRERIEGGHSTY